jgi:hypothetical protein
MRIWRKLKGGRRIKCRGTTALGSRCSPVLCQIGRGNENDLSATSLLSETTTLPFLVSEGL